MKYNVRWMYSHSDEKENGRFSILFEIQLGKMDCILYSFFSSGIDSAAISYTISSFYKEHDVRFGKVGKMEPKADILYSEKTK